MPKIVDHAERRTGVARAFARLVAEHGFAATTYARTAAATGVSVGTVQHYFSSRDEMARAAFDVLLADRDARISAAVAAGEAAQQPIAVILRDALAELLPTDDVRCREHRVTQWLRVEAPHDPGLAGIAVGTDHELHQRVATAVSNGMRCGEVEPGVDVATAASRLLATTHGLAIELAAAPGTAPGSVDGSLPTPDPAGVLDPVMATVFTGRCRRHDR